MALTATISGNVGKDLEGWARRVRADAGRVVAAEANDIANQARSRAPRGATGELARSIRVETFDSRVSRRARVSAEVPYVIYVEYGTSRQAAQPFMRPAAAVAERRFPARVRSTLR